jgi:phage terminase small subunit
VGKAKDVALMAKDDKEQMFVDLYFGESGFDAKDAYIKCGYSAKTAHSMAYTFLAKPSVQELMRQRKAELIEEHELSLHTVLKRFSNVAGSSMEHFTRLTSEGDRVVDLSNCTTEQLAAIQELIVDSYVEREGEEDERVVKRVRIKLYSAMDANDKLARILGAYTGKEAPQLHLHQTNIDARRQTVIVNADDAAKDYKEFIRG